MTSFPRAVWRSTGLVLCLLGFGLPTMVVTGADDNTVPPPLQRRLLLGILGAQQVIIPNAESFRVKGKPAVEELFRTQWSVTTWSEVLAQ